MADKLKVCRLCGKHMKIGIAKWFQYDNGEQFQLLACQTCANWHTKQLERDSKQNGIYK